jgi:transporter family protein
MILAFILLGEKITLLKAIAMILIGTGTYLMIQKKKETGKVSPKSNLWIVYASGAAIFASFTAILGKVGIEGIESNLGTAIRTVVVLIMAWLIVFMTGKQKTIKDIDRKSWLFLVLSGFATGGSWLCYYRALQTGPASVVVPIDKLSILFTIAFSYFFLKEKLTAKSMAGLAMIQNRLYVPLFLIQIIRYFSVKAINGVINM